MSVANMENFLPTATRNLITIHTRLYVTKEETSEYVHRVKNDRNFELAP